MSEYCKYCETEIIEDFNEFACCDEEKIDRLEKENAELKVALENYKYIADELASLVRVDIQNNDYKNDLMTKLFELNTKRSKANE